MKKSYEAPSAEMIKFSYRDQVVAASGLLANSGCYQDHPGNSGNNNGQGNQNGHPWIGNEG